jgi:hypothetical protein
MTDLKDLIQRRTVYVKPDWPAIIAEAQRASGRWVLIANAAPRSVMRTIRQQRHRALRHAEGILLGREGEVATLVDGSEVVDIYGKWVWFNPDAAPKRAVTGKSERRLAMRPQDRDALIAYAASIDRTRTQLLDEVLAKFINHGTTYRRHRQHREIVKFDSVNDYLWRKAQERAEVDGVKLVDALRFELRQLARGRG